MQARFHLLLVLAMLLFVSTFSLARAQSPDPLILSLDPNGATESEIPLPTAPDATSTTTTLYVRSVISPTEALMVRLDAHLIDASGVRRNEIAVGFTAHVPSADSPGTQNNVDATTTAFAVPSNGNPVAVTVTVSNISATGIFTGPITTQMNGVAMRGPQLVVTRLPKPELRIIGADSTNGIAITTPGSQFQAPFVIESVNQAPTKLLVSVSPLIGENNLSIVPDVQVNGSAANSAIEVAGLSAVKIQVSANLPYTGTYKSAIALVYDDARHSTNLVVTRQLLPAPVVIENIQPVRGELAPLFPNATTLRFSIRNTGAVTTNLTVPVLTNLNLVGTNDSVTQAHYGGATVTTADGKAVTAPISLAPGASEQLQMLTKDFQSAGKYQGKLEVSAPDANPVSVDAQFFMRQDWWVAALLIALGIVLSVGLKYLSTVLRPRIATELKLAVARDQLEYVKKSIPNLTTDEQHLLDVWENSLRKEYVQAQFGQAQNADALITVLDAKVKLFAPFINLRRRVATLTPPELRKTFSAQLDTVQAGLEAEMQADKITALEKQINVDIPKAIDDALRKRLLEQISALRTAMERFKNSARYATANSKLDQATALLNADPYRAEEYENARSAYDAALREYAFLYLDELDALSKQAQPAAFQPEEWTSLRQTLDDKIKIARDALDKEPQRAIDALNEAYIEYLKTTLTVLERQSKTTNAGAEVIAKLTEAKNALRDGNLAIAGKLAQELTDALYPQTPGKLGGVSISAIPFLNLFPGLAGGSRETETVNAFELGVPATLGIRNRLTSVDALLFIIVLIVAVVFGLQLLWINEATWGSWADVITAVLWGLGLHQVANQGFSNLSDLTQKILGTGGQSGASGV